MTEVGRRLSRSDLEDLLEGAALLGCGGGGPIWVGRQIIDAIEKAGAWPRLIQPQDLASDAWAAGTAAVALPGAIGPGAPFPADLARNAFLALETALGRRLDAVLPIALGPGNALLPALVAGLLDRPLVDVAAAPRACPFLTGYSFAQLPGPLTAACGLPGQPVQVLDLPNAFALQQLFQAQVMGPGGAGIGALATFAMTGQTLRSALQGPEGAQTSVAFNYGISRAIAIGRALRTREAGADPVEAVCRALGGRVLFRAATATDAAIRTGASALTFTALDGQSRLTVYHLAENLMAWRQDDPSPSAFGPDIITYLAADGTPFTNDATDLAAVAGQDLLVITAPVPDAWRAPAYLGTWAGGIAATTGYAGAYVPVPRREPAIPRPAPGQRDELIHLLRQASELEHLICCQYLYAAFSLKQGEAEGLDWQEAMQTRDWAQMLLLVARQEMEHLGLVANLLTSIGSAPHFSRPNFPQTRRFSELPFKLVPFCDEFLERVICLERPLDAPWHEACGPFREPSSLPADTLLGPEFSGEMKEGIAALYDRIRELIVTFPGAESDLFIGPPNAQIDGNLLHVNFPRPGALGGIWDVTLFDITDRATALRAIDLIVEQGEGGPGTDEYTHYRWFREMLEQLRAARLRNPSFQPARDMVSNPVLVKEADGSPHQTVVTHPATREVLDLFNGSYETLLLLLYRLYSNPEMDTQQVAAFAYTMLPMMTQVIRPLAEILTSLPAFEGDSSKRAGPSFEISNAIGLLPHADAALRVLTEKLSALSASAIQLGQRKDLPDRLTSIGQNLFIMANKFRSIAAGTYPPDLLVPGVAHFYTQDSTPH